MYLLDTNVISELRRSRPHGAVLEWLFSTTDSQLHIPAIAIGEIQAGIEKTRMTDRVKAEELEFWLEDVVMTRSIVPVDADVARCWAKIMIGRSAHLSTDALIAATALVHGLTDVTRNLSHFAEFGVSLLNPFAFRLE